MYDAATDDLSELCRTGAEIAGEPLLERQAVQNLLRRLQAPQPLAGLFHSRLTLAAVVALLAECLGRGWIALDESADGEPCILAGAALPWRLPPVAQIGPPVIDGGKGEALLRFRQRLSGKERIYKADHYQCKDTFESLHRRFALMAAFGDDVTDALLILGDDALFGIYYAICGMAQRVTIADIDDDLLMLGASMAEEFGLHHLNFVAYDVKQPMPAELTGRYDRFVSSGFKDLGGLLLFLSRGCAALRASGAQGAGYITFGTHEVCELEQAGLELELYRQMARMNCVVDCLCPCIEPEVPAALAVDFARSIRTLAGARPNARRALLQDAMTSIRAAHWNISWLRLPGYPAIRLTPIKAARFHVVDKLPAYARRMALLAQMAGKPMT